MAITSFIAGEAISAGNAVYINPSGFLYKAVATNKEQAAVIGLAIDTATSSNLVRVVTDTIYTSASTFTPGNFQYLSIAASGALVPYSTWETELTAVSASGAFLTNVGRALTTTNIEVEIQKPIYITK